MTLKELGQRASLSEGFISQLERGRVNASIGSLQRLTEALGTTVADLFETASPREGPVVLRRHERPTLAFGKLGRKYLLTPAGQDNLEIFVVAFEADGSTGDDQYAHGESDEFFLVLSGNFEVQVGDETFLLGPGDNVMFRSSTPHRAANISNKPGEVLWVTSPPSY